MSKHSREELGPIGFMKIQPLARLRITRNPPAPVMDGVDVSDFRLGRVYTVEASLAHYLVVAGYATLEIMLTDSVNDAPPRKRRRRK